MGEGLVFNVGETAREIMAWGCEAFRLSSSLEKHLKGEMMFSFCPRHSSLTLCHNFKLRYHEFKVFVFYNDMILFY